MSTSTISNSLAQLRGKAGLSAADLAQKAGVTRQTIYAIEAGQYIPNTAVALRLSRTLRISVEDLFQLSPNQDTEAAPPITSATPLPDERYAAGSPVQICQVDQQSIAVNAEPTAWCFPPSDGTMAATPSKRTARVRWHRPMTAAPQRLLIAGCDPALPLLARYLQPAGIELVLLHRNSSQALSLLTQGYIHIAGSHLRDGRTLPKSAKIISFAAWQEGLLVARGNPKRVRGVASLERRDVKLMNRERGAATRLLLDAELKKLHLNSSQVRGYHRTVIGHRAAALEVKSQAADCCIATEPVARFESLDFLPLSAARFDLVIGKRHFTQPAVQKLCDVLCRLDFRQHLAALGGYDTATTGRQLV